MYHDISIVLTQTRHRRNVQERLGESVASSVDQQVVNNNFVVSSGCCSICPSLHVRKRLLHSTSLMTILGIDFHMDLNIINDNVGNFI